MGGGCGLESEDPEMSTLAHGVLIACMDFSVTREGSSGKPDAQAKSLESSWTPLFVSVH